MANNRMVSMFRNIGVNIYGSSHSEEIGVMITGIPEGKIIDTKEVDLLLSRRKANNSLWSTKRLEEDIVNYVHGIKDNKVVDIVIRAKISNTNVKKDDYSNIELKPRPSHADYVAFVKDGNNVDISGGGRFSGRMTAPLCIAGGIIKGLLKEKGIHIGAYISEIAGVEAPTYRNTSISYQDITNSYNKDISTITTNESKRANTDDLIINKIIEAKEVGDSVGGIIEAIVYGMEPGIGDALFLGLEGRIAMSIYAIPAVKSVEFGSGVELPKMKGSEANDCFTYSDDKVVTKTNHSGGINGGISNGMPITIRIGVKPTPSICMEQDTVDLKLKKNTKIKIKGRHDSCIVPRAVPVVEAAIALAIYDCMKD